MLRVDRVGGYYALEASVLTTIEIFCEHVYFVHVCVNLGHI